MAVFMEKELAQEVERKISVEECRACLGDLELTDEEIEEIRDLLYACVEQVLDYVIEEGLVSDEKEYDD